MKIGYFYTMEHLDLISIPPTPLKIPDRGDAKFCPAIQSVIKNTFEIKCPYDIHMSFKGYNENDEVIVRLDPDNTTLLDSAFDSFIKIHSRKEWSDKNIPLIQFKPNIVFVTDEKGLTIEGFPPFLEYRPNLPIRSTAFKFNCYNWIRPCQYGIEWMNTEKPIIFKRRDTLMYIRFNTDKNIKLEKIDKTEKLERLVKRNIGVKEFVKGLSFHAMLIAGKTRPRKLL